MFDTFMNVVHAFPGLCSVQPLIAVVLGVLIGMIGGILPGVGSVLTLVLMLPFAFALSPAAGLILLAALQKGTNSGGSFSSILLGTPGTPAAAAVVEDGSYLAKTGKAGKAMQLGLFSSIIGDTASDLVLIFVAAPLAAIALMFGPPEVFSLMIFAMTIIGVVSSKHMHKGLIMAALGLMIACIGMDPVRGRERYTFGSLDLLSGVPLIPFLIGLYAISELLMQMEAYYYVKYSISSIKFSKEDETSKTSKSDNRMTWTDLKHCIKAIAIGSGTGSFIGALPGIGSATGAFVSQGFARKFSKEPDKFGKGSLEAIAAAESANSAVAGANLIPALSLGIPGDPPAVVVLGALMAFDLQPGPTLFQNAPDVLYLLFAGMMVAHVVNIPVGLLISKYARYMLKIPVWMLYPTIFLLAVTGSYADSNSIFGVKVMLIIGICAYFLRRTGFPLSPIAIAFILGSKIETPLRQTLLITRDDFSVFFTKPISLLFLICTAIMITIIWMSEGKTRIFSRKRK